MLSGCCNVSLAQARIVTFHCPTMNPPTKKFLNDVAMGLACGMAALLNPIAWLAIWVSSETLRLFTYAN